MGRSWIRLKYNMQTNSYPELPYQQMQIRPQVLVVTILVILLVFWLLNTEILPSLYPSKPHVPTPGLITVIENINPRWNPVKMSVDENRTYRFVQQTGDVLKYRVVDESDPSVNISYFKVLQLLKNKHQQFSQAFFKVLQHGLGTESGSAYFFETPPVTADSIHNKMFEFVLIPAPFLNNVQ